MTVHKNIVTGCGIVVWRKGVVGSSALHCR